DRRSARRPYRMSRHMRLSCVFPALPVNWTGSVGHRPAGSNPMLRLSKKADYALLAMRHLAANADRGAVSARELAEAYDLPPELLAKVLQRLVRARFLTSVQGI